MQNSVCDLCGGCVFRKDDLSRYRQNKMADFQKIMAKIEDAAPLIDEPIFIEDGLRRRADIAFSYTKKELKFGFNEKGTHNIVNLTSCLMLDSSLNEIIPLLKNFLEEFCKIKITVKNKKKLEVSQITEGSVHLLHADNGIDIMLNISKEIALDHRFLIADFVNAAENICRLSIKVNENKEETIIEKNPPKLYIKDVTVEVPAGAFLQASKKAETQMIEKVLSYLGNTTGKMADLFCGLGTFTYPLAQIEGAEIIAADSSSLSLNGLQKALNRNEIKNVKVINRNLFKYPFDALELKNIKAIVIDPPRAGAHEQCREIAKLKDIDKPQKIIFVSCNPNTFVYDAELLVKAGFTFEKVTLVDQFVYSKHIELIALFTYNPKTNKGA